jgi:hypothetical protein
MTSIGDLEDERATLAADITGTVLVPGDDAYAAETALFNLHLPLTPDLVVIPADAADVQTAVRYAADRKMPIAVKGSGHQVILPAEGGLLITTHRLRGVTVDPRRRTARVEAGTRWYEVLEATEPHGLAPIPGSAPHIGVAGYTLGGGLSPVLGRTHGYAADHVVSLDVVTADGELRKVTADNEPDLFWALRGCKGNFGIVTALEIELFPLTRVYAGGIFFPGAHSSEILHAWRSWVTTLPEEASTSVAVMRLPDMPGMPDPLRGAFVLHLRFAYLGSVDDGEKLLAPLRALAPAVIDAVVDMPITGIGAIHNDPVDGVPYWDRGMMLRELPAEAVDALMAQVGPDADTALMSLEIRHLGGALSREPAVPNAVPCRDAGFCAFAFGAGPAPLEGLGHAAPAAQLPLALGGDHPGSGAGHVRRGEVRPPGRDQDGLRPGEPVPHQSQRPASVINTLITSHL